MSSDAAVPKAQPHLPLWVHLLSFDIIMHGRHHRYSKEVHESLAGKLCATGFCLNHPS